MQPAGVIRQLGRYPVKSMGGEILPATPLTLQGMPEDRRYAFVQATSRSSFPWLTARELPELLCYGTSVEGSGLPEVAVTVTTPSGEKWPVASDELRRVLEERSGRALFLLRDYRGSYDVAPISLISRQTITRIAEESETREDPLRFRPNLLVDLEGGQAFDELNWVGRILRVGNTARIAITEVDKRCMMITLDPANGKASPGILRCVVQRHAQSAGVYATVLTPGEVSVGDTVVLEF
jgi:MOSC domain-containing protein